MENIARFVHANVVIRSSINLQFFFIIIVGMIAVMSMIAGVMGADREDDGFVAREEDAVQSRLSEESEDELCDVDTSHCEGEVDPALF